MDWSLIFSVSLTTAVGPVGGRLRPGRHRPERALRLHRPAQLRPGRRSSPSVPTRSPWASTPSGCRSGCACSSCSSTASVLALILGVPTLRLRADYLAIVTIAAGEIIRLVLRAARFRETTGGAAGIQDFADDFFDLNPFGRGTYALDIPGTVDRRRVHRHRRSWVLLVGWSLVALTCRARLPPGAQPVGPGAQGHPGGRGRRAQPRQERLLLQDAVPRRRRRDRRHRRRASSPSPASRWCPTASAPRSPSSPT